MIYTVIKEDSKKYEIFDVAINNQDLYQYLKKELTKMCAWHKDKDSIEYSDINRKCLDDGLLYYQLKDEERNNEYLNYFVSLVCNQGQANLKSFEYKKDQLIDIIVINIEVDNKKYLCIQKNNKENVLQQEYLLGIPRVLAKDSFKKVQDIIILKKYFDAVITLEENKKGYLYANSILFYKPANFILLDLSKKFKTIYYAEYLIKEIKAKQLTNDIFHLDSLENLKKLNQQRIKKLGDIVSYPLENIKELKKYVSIRYPYKQENSFHYYFEDKIFFPNDLNDLKNFVDDIANSKHPYQIPKLLNGSKNTRD